MAAQEALGQLAEIANRKTAFIGLGNRDRGDDAVGLRFVEDLRQLNPKYFFSEENGLESIILQVMKDKDVDNVIFIDSCDFDSKPGDVRLLKLDNIDETISTHKIPLSMLMALIQSEGKKAYLVGIQPEALEFGKEISLKIKASLNKVEKSVRKKLKI